MQYLSTRDPNQSVSSAQAILSGISPEGGLYVPQEIPQVSRRELESLCTMNYQQRAQWILSRFLTDFTQQELEECVNAAYGDQFDDETPAPISCLAPNTYLLELWHGPTCAFKDMALQILPHLLVKSAQKCGSSEEVVILVATSGDTGKAALEGFKDVPGTRMVVFYPRDGVSPMQKLQMQTQEGDNLRVCAIEGNFDDAQTGVKEIFVDPGLLQKMEFGGFRFSSANSINWGRLVPQVVYYFSGYCDLVASGEISPGESIHVVVPTGNFGNILAAYLAKKMGLPIGKLLCASNENDVLTEFLHTGTYNRMRPFHLTYSPSMDILVSSNLERLLYLTNGGDTQQIRQWMDDLKQEGQYTIPPEMLEKIQQDFWACSCDDRQTLTTISDAFQVYSYLCDPHTAVALHTLQAYRQQTQDQTKALVASTASPYKFADCVLKAIGCSDTMRNGFEAVRQLQERSGVKVPAPILALSQRQVRFDQCIRKSQMKEYVLKMLGI